jgi:hypothetical protein
LDTLAPSSPRFEETVVPLKSHPPGTASGVDLWSTDVSRGTAFSGALIAVVTMHSAG